jgi:serine/threonine protein kinase
LPTFVRTPNAFDMARERRSMGCGASHLEANGVHSTAAGGLIASLREASVSKLVGYPNVPEEVDDREWWEELMTPGLASDTYDMGKVLGRGASSVVREGHHKHTRERVACKVMMLVGCTAEERVKQRDRIMREVEVWGSLNDPNILNLIEFFVTDTSVRAHTPFPAPVEAAEHHHPTRRERMGSLTLQTLHDPILLHALHSKP